MSKFNIVPDPIMKEESLKAFKNGDSMITSEFINDLKIRYEVVKRKTSKFHPYMPNQELWYIYDKKEKQYSLGCYLKEGIANEVLKNLNCSI